MAASARTALVSLERITHSILILRGQRVILDRELAAIYGVPTGRLNEAIKRNAERFPEDFMFRLTREEIERSRSQIAILNGGRGRNIKYLPHAFTEHGAIQAANVLMSRPNEACSYSAKSTCRTIARRGSPSMPR